MYTDAANVGDCSCHGVLFMLPNLSALPLATGERLFQYVAMQGGGKSKCRTHTEPIVTNQDNDPEQNCAVDGYLMFKPMPDAVPIKQYPFGKPIEVEVDGTLLKLEPLKKRSSSWIARKEEFEIKHSDWIKNTFPLVCDRGEGLQAVTWEGYGDELATITEWYFLDPSKRGHLFVQLLNTPARKKRFHMPSVGMFEGDYLYIALVCATGGQGYGKTLMKLAEGAAKALGCTGVALSSLSNSAGFYYSLGFSFVSKEDGKQVDVARWTKQIVGKDGLPKTLLQPMKDVDDPTEPMEGTEPVDDPPSFSQWLLQQAGRLFGRVGPSSLQAAM